MRFSGSDFTWKVESKMTSKSAKAQAAIKLTKAQAIEDELNLFETLALTPCETDNEFYEKLRYILKVIEGMKGHEALTDHLFILSFACYARLAEIDGNPVNQSEYYAKFGRGSRPH
jgi:hypothetical protein